MNKSITIKLIAFISIITPATGVLAHDLHGISDSHWHASDAFGFVILAAAIGLTLWFSQGGK